MMLDDTQGALSEICVVSQVFMLVIWRLDLLSLVRCFRHSGCGAGLCPRCGPLQSRRPASLAIESEVRKLELR
jgi:hypothetical protein